jgi:hypothetical protein
LGIVQTVRKPASRLIAEKKLIGWNHGTQGWLFPALESHSRGWFSTVTVFYPYRWILSLILLLLQPNWAGQTLPYPEKI